MTKLTDAIPGLTDEMARKWADILRADGHTPEKLRRVNGTLALFHAALMEHYPPKPVLTVGEMARTKRTGFKVKVCAPRRCRGVGPVRQRQSHHALRRAAKRAERGVG